MADRQDYSSVRDLGVDDTKRERLYAAQTECTVTWTNAAGWPVGVMHRFVWSEGKFWVTCTDDRVRVAALRKRPQSCVIVSSEGTWLGSDITTTAKTLATVHDDDEVRAWFYPALAARRRATPEGRQEFLRRLNTPGRVIIELAPVDWITYDGVRLESSLRGIEYDPARYKPTLNQTSPPDDTVMIPFD